MKFIKTPLPGAYLIELEPHGDERGFFSRLFCKETFEEQGLEPLIRQINNSHSTKKGTLRGLHYQKPPHEETKLVRCISGSLYDVIVDVRRDSPTFGHFFGAYLTAEKRNMLYVPRGCAHGFLTLEDNVEIIYFVSETYSAPQERGIRWDDPFFKIDWPEQPLIISARDLAHPNFTVEEAIG